MIAVLTLHVRTENHISLIDFLISQMSFARDRLYKGYLLRRMATIVSTVKTREIVPHLSCLTDHDRVRLTSEAESVHVPFVSDNLIMICFIIILLIMMLHTEEETTET